MRLGIVFWSVVVAMCVAQRASQAQGPGICCYKRTFGYDQIWSAQPASPQMFVQPLMMACPAGSCDAAVVSPKGDGSEGHAGMVMMPQMVVMPSTPIFRLCVACPPNASVIIDGQKTKPGDRLRQYQLELSRENPPRQIEVIVLQGDQDILWKDVIPVKAGATRTIVVPSKKLQVQPASLKKQVNPPMPAEAATLPPSPVPPVPASPEPSAAVENEGSVLAERLAAVEKQLVAIDAVLQRIEELQSEKVKQKARYLNDRQKLLDERQEVQDERQSFQQEMGEILKARAAALKDKVAEVDAKQEKLDKMQDARDQLQQRRDKLQIERDTQQVSREAGYATKQKSLKDQADKTATLQTEREHTQDARDKLQRERDTLQQARDKLQNERDTLQRSRDN